MAIKPTQDTSWAINNITDPGSGQPNKIEPSTTKKNSGYVFLEKPPFNWFNYSFNALHLWKEYFEDSIDEILSSTLIISGNKTFTGITTISNTTQSTSKDTGALIIDGGVGIEKNTYIGGNFSSIGTITCDDTTDSTSKDTGCLILQGGAGIEKSVYIGGNINTTLSAIIGGAITCNDTTDSTSKDTGCLILQGGAGIEKSVYIGGNLNVAFSVTVTGNIISNGTTESTSKDTGAIVTEGGIGAEKNISAGGLIRAVNGFEVIYRNSAGAESTASIHGKIIEIGDWDMDTNAQKIVNHGIADASKILSIDVLIREDSGLNNFVFSYFGSLYNTSGTNIGEGGCFIFATTGTAIQLQRATSGYFDSLNFNATSYNRGWIYIVYRN